jgi:hypothetical protein
MSDLTEYNIWKAFVEESGIWSIVPKVNFVKIGYSINGK